MVIFCGSEGGCAEAIDVTTEVGCDKHIAGGGYGAEDGSSGGMAPTHTTCVALDSVDSAVRCGNIDVFAGCNRACLDGVRDGAGIRAGVD